MELSNNWTIGEIVTLPQEEKLLKENGMYHYLFHIGSRYVCIREAVNGWHTAESIGKNFFGRR